MAETDMTKLYENLPDNSHKAREAKRQLPAVPPEKRAEKVVHGTVKTKKNEARKWADLFISEDVANVKNYILMDVIIPSIKKAAYDLIVGTLDMTLYGGRGGSSNRRPTADKISYTDYSGASRDSRSRNTTRTASGYSYDDIILDSRGEAEAILIRMDELIDEYKEVRVADLYDLAGITGEYTDNKYGWTDIRSAEVIRVRDGYKIKMPRAVHLK
jgi:hypothetical protein